MPLIDTAAMAASLDNDYGPTRGPQAADEHEVALFAGDPVTGEGVELAGNGYARVTIDSDDWPSAAADGIKSMTVTFPDSTGAWNTATHFALYDPDAEVWWDSAPLANGLTVTGPGDGPVVEVALFYDDAITDPF